ncbi:F-box only protein 36-like [Symsagittifera roscoffensis]|uniref:F-box only protein 36-like n=1 Tax=Symsagittifera roscoffensis TaxID=84072 RepID=UPI00307B1424
MPSSAASVSSKSSGSRMTVSSVGANVNLFEVTAQERSPKKDFCQLVVNKEQVIFRRWIISLRVEATSLRPIENKYSHEDFLEDEQLQADVRRIFGPEALNKARCLCEGRVDWVAHMPLPILLYVISFLDLVDVANLSQVNSFFRETCSSDLIWEELFFRHNDDVSEELIDLAMERGWKEVFFANKLHLRVLLNRRQREKLHENGDENSSKARSSAVFTRRAHKFSPRRSSTPRVNRETRVNEVVREPLGPNESAINENSSLSFIDEQNDAMGN